MHVKWESERFRFVPCAWVPLCEPEFPHQVAVPRGGFNRRRHVVSESPALCYSHAQDTNTS